MLPSAIFSGLTFTEGSKNTHASTVIPVEKAIPYLQNLHSIITASFHSYTDYEGEKKFPHL